MAQKNAVKKKKTPPAPPEKKIFIVDDHPLFREGLAGIIRQRPEWCICGQADSAVKAFEEIRRLKPDIVVTDIGLAGKSGLELVKDIHAFSPDLPILVISMHDEILYAERVLKAGGRGYIMKQEGPEKILQAITKVLAEQVSVSEKMAAGILEHIVNPSRRATSSPIEKLSDREFEVLRLIGEGQDYHQIAKTLSISIKTVNCHRLNIKEKLGLKSANALVHFASRWIGEEA
ncbi:MAG: response regulator transcription factor [Verrucomicrobiales bacterium]